MTLIQIRELKPESLYFPGIKDRRKSKAVFLNYFIHTAEISRHQLASMENWNDAFESYYNYGKIT